MPAILSTLRHPTVRVLADARPSPGGKCVVVQTDGVTGGAHATMHGSRVLSQRDPPPVPCYSLEHFQLLSDLYSASESEVDAGMYGVAVLFTSYTLGGSANWTAGCVRISHLVRIPRIFRDLAAGRCPHFVDMTAIALLRSHGAVYPAEPDLPAIGGLGCLPPVDDESVCIFCFVHPRQYRWSGCFHPNDSRGALICNKCCNVLRRRQLPLDGDSIRGTHILPSPCPLCRTVGEPVCAAILDPNRAAKKCAP
jgi:hypothetical protein